MTPTEQAHRRSFQQTLDSARRTMVLSEILKLAYESFAASKMRFLLTSLGMVIGTASVILVVTIGLTGKQFVINEIQKIGTNSVELEYAGGSAAALGERDLQRLPDPRGRKGGSSAVSGSDVFVSDS